jgi:hypothetical protein
VVEDVVTERGLIDDLRERLVEVELGDRLRRARVRDVAEVDVVLLDVVDRRGVDLLAVLPDADVVRVVGRSVPLLVIAAITSSASVLVYLLPCMFMMGAMVWLMMGGRRD